MDLVLLLAASRSIRQLITCGRQARPHPIDGEVSSWPGWVRTLRSKSRRSKEARLPSAPLAYETSGCLVEGRVCGARGADVSPDSVRSGAPLKSHYGAGYRPDFSRAAALE